ncbi:hypothetical protein AvCA_18360 [Azotobacter vinelandii CA]|uniref:Uncharacterized protein n=2 Tax=Azotobacter vinelandii TaxID=354 RepID=C1DDS7_AZOVD|nr:hypothetical protein [Azotobacter vinelandii]ACO78048.1 hypothetical protein Avin_18360 [Azotobacter vinelandii DJ]AGK15156.1 hypothetical protein AvCA_18360 [Azotobacter vinelandii CA]AGK20204.1 hypothetical protein AvCA6_18360 [Azotobacter vinelandii CA6]WKN23764.1 hypothetical protein AVAEIV_001873 [Azotobacter vinelandii]SFY07115.1 hypothetical protein SAMN04244547_03851 [Azotobacter vinelandii]
MSSFEIESWRKTRPTEKSVPMGLIHFYIGGDDRQHLEQAEERLQSTGESEALVEVDLNTLELVTPPECGPLSDCHLRVYLRPEDRRGQFHLVGHRASDGSLIYTNALLIDSLM